MNIQLLLEMENKAEEQGQRAFRNTLNSTKNTNEVAKAKTKAIVKTVNGFNFHNFETTNKEEFEETKKFYQESLKEELSGRG